MVFIGRVSWKKALLVVGLLCFTAGFYSGRTCEHALSSRPAACELRDPNSLPSQADIQRVLNARGVKPKLKVDGFIGDLSRTAWNAEVFNDYAREAMVGMSSNDKDSN